MAVGEFYNCIKETIILFVFVFLFGSCSENEKYSNTIRVRDAFFDGEVKVEKIEKLNKYKLTIFNSTTGASDHIYTPYEIFQMETGDVNHDGKTDICIGIIKPTPFDSVFKKRLFIFQIDRDYIRPLWLGSRLVYPMEEFKICKNADRLTIKTIERQNLDLFCINEYRWESFGMSFLKKHKDFLTFSNAQFLLHNQQ